ncbi:MAG: cell envelope opacity-associated protein A [Cyclobacteriaceae bacterium]|jgi:cell envelope opacity-associated protein A
MFTYTIQRKMRLLILSFLVTLLFSSDLIAQKNDPYSDYSHLWQEDASKKKKKSKKNRNATEIVIPQDTIPKQPTDSLQQQTASPDSTQSVDQVNSTMLSAANDSVPQQITMPADTIPQSKPVPVDTAQQSPPTFPTDTVPSVDDAPLDTTTQAEPEKIKEKKPLSLEPVASDFRSGTGGGASGTSTVNGGVTFTQIDGQYYAGLTLQPELSIWKIGVGLNVPILFNIEDQSFRSDIFKDGVGLARTITYIRYGVQKQDPVYVRVGELNGIMIGFGGLINNYTNSTSFEKRKLGLHYDVNFKGLIGLEGMYSDFDPTSSNLLVTRPYIRPLSFLSIPIVRTLEIGTTFVTDNDQTKRPTSDSTFKTNSLTNGVKAFGIDAGINLLSVPFVQIDAFLNYGRLDLGGGGLNDSISQVTPEPGSILETGFQDGSGTSYGVNFRFNFIADLLSTDIRIERLNYTDNYLPQFFDFSYELNKDARIWSTTSAASRSGIYGSLTGHILQTIHLGGSLMIPDAIGVESPAVIQLNASAERVADKFSLQGSYLKGNLANLSDAFKLDERSITKVRFIYHMNKFLAAGLDYYWAFTPAADGSFKATRYVSPYFGLSIQF